MQCDDEMREELEHIFEQILSKKRNKLEQPRINVLEFVKYNLWLELRKKERAK